MSNWRRRLAHSNGHFLDNDPLGQDRIGDTFGEGFDQIEHSLPGQVFGKVTDLPIMDRLFHLVG